MRRSRLLLGFAALFLPAWVALVAVPVRFRAELAGAKGALNSGLRVSLRLIPQNPSEMPKPVATSLSVPGETLLELPPGVTWQLVAESPGLWSAPQWIAPPSGEAELVVTLRLFPAGEVTGVLKLLPGTRQPSTVDLRLEASPIPSPGSRPPATSLHVPVEKGRFHCQIPAARLDLRLMIGGFAPVYLWDVGIQAGEVKDLGALSLAPGASVVGWVRTQDAKALGGARVRLEPQSIGLPRDRSQAMSLKAMALESETNDRGFFQMKEVVPGMTAVKATKEGFAAVMRSGIEVRPELEAQILEPLVLTPPLTLQVTLDPPLAPSGSAWKLVASKQDKDEVFPEGPVYRGEAGPEGTWEQHGLGTGRYVVTVSEGETSWLSEAVEVTPEKTAFHFSLPGVRIVGRARIGKEPLEASLWFGGRGAPRRARFDSDAKGSFAGLLPEEGKWNVEIVAEKEGLRLGLDPVEVRRRPGQSHAVVEIHVPNTRLRGRVVDEHGSAVQKASLLLFAPHKRGSVASTDAAGDFEMRGLSPGSFFVHAEEGSRESEWLEAHVEEDRDTPELRLVLRTRMSVQGRIFSADGPVAGARVMAQAQVNEAGAGSGDEAVTGSAGEFTVKLPSGSQIAHLSVLAPGYATRMLIVPLGAESLLEIPLERIGGTLVLDLGDRTLEEAMGAGAGLLAHAGSFVPFNGAVHWARLLRAEQGDLHRLVLPNMEAGDYLLCLGGEAQAAVPRGQKPPAAQCSRGSLAPLQELRLTLPQVPKTPAT